MDQNETQTPRMMGSADAAGSDSMHWSNWLWIVPFSIMLSPIGTIILTEAMGLDFWGCLKLIGVQVAAFALLYVITNGGE